MRLDGEMEELASRQHALVATWQLQQLGATRTEISRLRGSRRWEPIGSTVLAVRGSPRTDLQRVLAAVLAGGPSASLAFESAGAVWGLGQSFDLLPAQVASAPNLAHRAGRLGDHRKVVNLIERWTTVLGGIPIVCPELCIFQLCASVHPGRAERALDHAWSLGLLTGRSARACLEALRASGRNGTRAFEELLDARGDDWVPPASGLESRFQSIARDHGFTFRRQVNVGDAERWVGRVDFADVVLPLVVEVLSERYHLALSFRVDDAARRARLDAAGYEVVEVWDVQIWNRPHEVVAMLREARSRARRRRAA